MRARALTPAVRGFLRRLGSAMRRRLPTRRPKVATKERSGGPVPVRFVLFCEERIGADRLVWLLRQHPDIRVDDAGLADTQDAEPDEQLRSLHSSLDGLAVGRVKAAGLRVGLGNVFDREGLAEALRELRPRLVVVRHQNLVRVTLFREAAGGTGWLNSWNRAQTGKGDRVSPPRMRGGPKPFGPQRFTSTLRAIEVRQIHLRRFVGDLDLDVLEIDEEDLLTDEAATVAKVLSYLDVAPASGAPRPLRAADERYLEVFDDIEAIRTHLEDTPYDRMLEALLDRRPAGA